MKNTNFLFACSMALVISCTQEKPQERASEQKDPVELTKDERMEWWREAKFGMFIHWGPYAVPAGIHEGQETTGIAEWIMHHMEIPIERYEEYSRTFNPQDFDADEWVSMASSAGVRYIVITSKHHDGFAIWDSDVSDYNIVDYTEFGRDVLKELKEACDKYDVRLGFYHSIMDWHHPQAQAINEPSYNPSSDNDYKINPEFDQYVENYMKPQLEELVTKYDPAILWFDGEWIPDYTHAHGLDVHQFVMGMKPDILINNRVDKGRQGMQGMNKEGDFVGDFGTPEQEILEGTSESDWESCMTMNDTWGYNQTDENWKSTHQLVFNLVDVAAKGGNYLLNVGPMANGKIPQASIDRMLAIGEWMDVNSEAIYDTEKLNTSFGIGEELRYIKKKDQEIYYVVKFNNLDEPIDLSVIEPNGNTIVELLGYSGEVSLEEGEGGWRINPPTDLSDGPWDVANAWVFKISNANEDI